MRKTFTSEISKISFIVNFILLSTNVFGQMTVLDAADPLAPFDPITLISNVFISGGVDIQSITYQGDLEQVGYFQNGSGIGLNDGLILSTGLADQAPVLNSLSTTGGGFTGNPTSSPQLQALASGFSLNDIVQYEIIFTPTTSSLSFQYVFASEEYETYAPPNNSSFNDVFGFFLSSPGGAAPYTNIAFVPGTTTPVSINNINPVTNNSLYVSNVAGTQHFKYGGYTTVMTATANLVPCQQYRIILAIADAGDSAFDSAILLGGGSFTFGGIQALANTPSADTVLAEGCGNGTMEFSLFSPADANVPITYTVGGTATMGIDYDTIPLSGIIPIGGTSFSFPIVPLEDGVNDGREYIEFVYNVNPCVTDTIIVYIDESDLNTQLSDAFICTGDSVVLDATAPIITPPPYIFYDSTGQATPDTITAIQYPITIAGFPYPNITPGMIESISIDITSMVPSFYKIFLIAPDGSFLELTTDNGGVGNQYGSTSFTSNTSDPVISASSAPFSGNYQPEGFWNFLNGSPVNGTWTLQIGYSISTPVPGTLNSWSINFAPFYDIQYNWTPTTNLTPNSNVPVVTLSPMTTTDYAVDLTDSYGCVFSDTATIFVDDKIPAPIVSCGNITNSSIEFTWLPITNITGYEVNINGTGWIPASAILSHLVTGVASNTTVSIEVRAIQPAGLACTLPPEVSTVQSCTTSACALTTSIATQTDASCNGGTDGSVTVTAPTGVPPYAFSINGSPTQPTGVFNNLAAGTYNVIVSDDSNCSQTQVVTIGEPNPILIGFSTIDASCNGFADGSITASATNGTPNYTFVWDANAANQTTATASSLVAGNYTVTVTDANGCTGVNDTTITEPALITFTPTSTNVSCNGGSDATITITNTTTGNPPLEYSIDGGTTFIANSGIFTGLTAGTYMPVCRLLNGACEVTGTPITITEPTQITTTTASTDATCNSSGDGTATVTPSGGTGTYTYLWDVNAASQTTATATGLNQGTFAVTITDANNCQIDTTVDVNVPSPIVLTMASTNLSCLGASDGTATVSASGGNGTYTYAWNTTPTQTTATATSLSDGTWIVTVTDGNGCFDTAQVTMNSTIVIGISFMTTDVTCNNGNDGTATATAVTNGNAPYNYSWSTTPNQTNQTATTLTAGTYTVTITDDVGCMGVDSTVINEPTALVATTDSTELSCYEDGTGTATITVTGGTGTYTYLWDANAANQTTATATNLQAGTYDVTATDANNCTIVATAIVTQPDSITLVMTNTAVSCNTAADGTATVTATGGTAPYTYAWNTTPVQNTATATGLSGGLYTVMVTDANNCSKIDTVSVYEPPLITFTVTQTNATCNNGTDGTITITNTTTGNPAIEYSIDNGVTFQPTGNFTGLAAGTYNPILRFTNGNCAVSDVAIIITEPTAISIVASSTNITCNGANDGTATASASGGTGNLSFTWSTTPVQTTASISNLAAGTYTVTVTDDNNCTNTESVIITEPTGITYSAVKTDLLCNNDNSGTATITASGGTGTLTYAWSNGETTAAIINLAAGTYTYTVTDASNCFITDNVIITEPAVLTSSTTSTDISCFNANDGTGTVTPIGGTMAYTYIWSNGMSGATATALPQGTTTVTVTDANGCTTTDSVLINEPTQIITSIVTTNANCNGVADGTATVTTVGGAGNYTYSLNGVVMPSNVFSNLAANTYNVVVTDGTGCIANDNFVITEPTPIVLSTTMTMVACSGGNDGTATVTASGGTGTYTYLWSSNPTQTTQTATALGTGTYTVTVTDANGCTETSSIQVTTPNPLTVAFAPTNVGCAGENTGAITTNINGGVPNYTFAWNNGMTAQNLSNIPAGNYILTITDANGCSIVDSVEITEPGLPLAITTTFTDVTCFGGNDGTAAATVTGGTAPYTYIWNTAPNQFTAVATNLIMGTYTVSVTDANGCATTATVVIDEPSAITLLTTETSASCFGAIDGTATVNASGGTPTGTNDYTYLWNSTPQQTTQTATNLVGGQTYTVVVTDSLGCTSTESITISQPDEIVLTTTQVNVTCDGFFDASATVTATGGTPTFTYLWDANANNQTTQTAIDLGSGTYEVTVTDVNGCTATTSVTIIEPNPLFINTTATAVACKGDATGSASAIFSGGTAPYSPVWSFNNRTTSTINNVPAGTYFVTLTDANGCQLIDSVIVNEPNENLGTTAEKVDNTCYDDRTGEIILTGTGGTFPYQYSLDGENYSNSNQFVGLAAGNYEVYTQDANGCLFNQTVTITEPAEFTLETADDREIPYGNAARLEVTPTNGVEPITYTWTPDATLDCNPCQSPRVDSLLFDTYFEVFAVDANGCEAEDGMFVRVTTPRRVFIATGMTPNDDGNNDILYVQGGDGTVEVTSFQIFDRWGELVFEANDTPLNDSSFGWDGTYKGQDAQGGVYIWVAQVKFTDGSIITYQGATNLIR